MLAGGVTSGGVSGVTVAVSVPVGDEVAVSVVAGVVLGVSLGVGVVDVALGLGVRVLLWSGRDVLLSVGDGAGLGSTDAGGGRTSR